ncbi:GFA family protein [Rubrimonas cliftonensis]|uniref:Uncharacterized conserved protein n=1 Tax=Rubrimonas cliftonensis TaxID=89524 RepID=A0A1H3VNN7_9RHOB|nr:GFA family protein [Rubrimonas cliftonensis]SDZ76311.1 Uncharacterized conserved protein [Rubrimonas cliftonensis]
MPDADLPLSGRCNCGGVAFTVDRLTRDRAAACHCRECRRGSGHVWAAVTAPVDALRFSSDATLRWWRASPRAERGFCARCGGFLFWRPEIPEGGIPKGGNPESGTAEGGAVIDIALGLLDAPTGVRLDADIFTAEKGDYYDLGALPAFAHGRPGVD